MAMLYENHASSRILFQLDATDTECIVGQGEGELFPDPKGNDFFWVTLDAGENGLEICKCIYRVKDTLSLVRAQQGTTALTFAANTLIDARLTKGSLDHFLQKSGGNMQGNINMGGYSISNVLLDGVTIDNAHITNFTTDQEQIIPTGLICMWSGANEDVPEGWALCDGQNSTPDLRDRFILAASANFPTNSVGGSKDCTTEECGPHNHGGATEPTALTKEQLPDIQLEVSREMYDPGPGGHNPIAKQWRIIDWVKDGFHIMTSPLNLGGPSGGIGHDHAINDDGVHQHQITGIMPEYYALAYIIKV